MGKRLFEISVWFGFEKTRVVGYAHPQQGWLTHQCTAYDFNTDKVTVLTTGDNGYLNSRDLKRVDWLRTKKNHKNHMKEIGL